VPCLIEIGALSLPVSRRCVQVKWVNVDCCTITVWDMHTTQWPRSVQSPAVAVWWHLWPTGIQNMFRIILMNSSSLVRSLPVWHISRKSTDNILSYSASRQTDERGSKDTTPADRWPSNYWLCRLAMHCTVSVLWCCWLGGRKGIRSVINMGDGGGGHWLLVRMEWRPSGWLVCLPLLIFPCTIKSRSSLLVPAHPGGLGRRSENRRPPKTAPQTTTGRGK